MKTVVLWGAGATASLRIATTEQQSSFWRSMLDETRNPDRKSYGAILSSRSGGLFGEYEDNIADLLELLDDTRGESSRGKLRNHGLVHFSKAQEKIIGKYKYDLGGAAEMAEDRAILEKAKDRVVMMRIYYDWSALMLIMRTQYNNKSDDANDDKFVECVYNVIDSCLRMKVGFRVYTDPQEHRVSDFLGVDRLKGARNAFILLTNLMFACAYREEEKRGGFEEKIAPYDSFMGQLVELTAEEHLKHDGNTCSVVSFNYDPLFWWLFQKACIDYNRHPICGGSPTCPVFVKYRMSVDCSRATGFGIFPDVRSEDSACYEGCGGKNVAHLNMFYPHGCLNWRTCPCCGKTFLCQGSISARGDVEQLFIPGFFGKLAWGFPDSVSTDFSEGNTHWNQGEKDFLCCPRCGAPTEWRHCDIIPQSGIKPMPSSFLQQEYYNVSAELMSADHVVMMGYRLPPDDALWAATVAARVTRANKPVKCSVVGRGSNWPCGWHKCIDLSTNLNKNVPDAVSNARRIFGAENVRVNLCGVPAVFQNGDSAAIYDILWPREF